MTSVNWTRRASYAFLVFLMGAGMYVGMDRLAAQRLEASLACGSEANPCEIAPLEVTVSRTAVRFVEQEEASPIASMRMSVRS